MNQYFKPRTPKPGTGAWSIVLRSMLCALAVLVVGTRVWLGLGAIHTTAVSENLVDNGSNGPSTNNVLDHDPRHIALNSTPARR